MMDGGGEYKHVTLVNIDMTVWLLKMGYCTADEKQIIRHDKVNTLSFDQALDKLKTKSKILL